MERCRGSPGRPSPSSRGLWRRRQRATLIYQETYRTLLLHGHRFESRSGACGAPVVRLRESRPNLDHDLRHHRPHTEAALAKIRSGRWRANDQAENWVGHAIAEVLGVDVRDAEGKAKVKAALDTWLVSGRLRVVTAKDEKEVQAIRRGRAGITGALIPTGRLFMGCFRLRLLLLLLLLLLRLRSKFIDAARHTVERTG